MTGGVGATARWDIPGFAALAIVEGGAGAGHAWPEEEETLAPSVANSRRASFRLGRLAAHRALAQLGLDTGPVLRGEGGRPSWPKGAVGSITNKPSVAAALVAPDNEVIGIGIDLEFVRPAFEIESVVLRAEELSWVAKMSEVERNKAVVSVFAAKEAIFKALYPVVRRRFGFDAASLEPREGGFEARLVEDLHPLFPRHSRLDVGASWASDRVVCWVVKDAA